MVTQVRWKDAWIRRVILFQSVPQMLSWAACYFVICLVIVGVSKLLHISTIDPKYFMIGFVGTLPSLYAALPCTFSIADANKLRVEMVIDRMTKAMGYVEVLSKKENKRIYRSKLPRLFRWDENIVVVNTLGSNVEVQAPKLIATKLREAIMKEISGAQKA